VDTIAAIVTPRGKGGVGVIRVSGEQVRNIAIDILGQLPTPRYAKYLPFLDANLQPIDIGIALLFPAPHSFTGEDVLELQGHGGPVVLDSLLKRILELGARQAKPGEFSERAFLNDKIDLAQAESIADLINANSEQAARAAMRSLAGEFSRRIEALVEALIQLRLYIEAAIDFPEEEIDFLNDGHIQQQLAQIIEQLMDVQKSAQQGAVLQEGIRLAIVGRPNAGKSSLLNCLSGKAVAIVTNIAGTTRDIVRETIQLDGIPLHILDTAGLRESSDVVEQEGIRRTWAALRDADQVLLVVDSQNDKTWQKDLLPQIMAQVKNPKHITVIGNKIDLTQESAGKIQHENYCEIKLSIKTSEGIASLLEHLKYNAGLLEITEGLFSARRRHLEALSKAQQALTEGLRVLQQLKAGELLAEHLYYAQQALSEITGEFHSDDLLARIFSSFCIGK
jgi:tRNA modification GTPase